MKKRARKRVEWVSREEFSSAIQSITTRFYDLQMSYAAVRADADLRLRNMASIVHDIGLQQAEIQQRLRPSELEYQSWFHQQRP